MLNGCSCRLDATNWNLTNLGGIGNASGESTKCEKLCFGISKNRDSAEIISADFWTGIVGIDRIMVCMRVIPIVWKSCMTVDQNHNSQLQDSGVFRFESVFLAVKRHDLTGVSR